VSEREQAAGLYTIVTQDPATPGKREPLLAWILRVQQWTQAVAEDEKVSEGTRMLAKRCQKPAARAAAFLLRAANRGHLNALEVGQAMDVMRELTDAIGSVDVNESLERRLDGARRGSAGARKGAIRKHERAAAAIKKKIEAVVRTVKSLKALGYSRSEILKTVLSKHRVNSETARKNPLIRPHLPNARRKSSP
jgi:hypothetical protein